MLPSVVMNHDLPLVDGHNRLAVSISGSPLARGRRALRFLPRAATGGTWLVASVVTARLLVVVGSTATATGGATFRLCPHIGAILVYPHLGRLRGDLQPTTKLHGNYGITLNSRGH